MPADRCPTCDREGCPRPAAVAAYQSSRADGDELAKAIAMIDAEGKCIAASMASRDARRRERAASMTRRIVGDAAKWRKVEPLIERLCAFEDGPTDLRDLLTVALDVLAATKEPS